MTRTELPTVQVPCGLIAVLAERDVFEAPEFKGRFEITAKGNRATIAGTVADLAELGDYIDGLADLVRYGSVTASELGYGHAKLVAFAARFPTRQDVPAETADEPEATPEERTEPTSAVRLSKAAQHGAITIWLSRDCVVVRDMRRLIGLHARHEVWYEMYRRDTGERLGSTSSLASVRAHIADRDLR